MTELIKPIIMLTNEEVIKKMGDAVLEEIADNIKLTAKNKKLEAKNKKYKDNCRETLFENHYNK